MTVRWLARGMRAVPLSASWLSPEESARLASLRFPKRRIEVRLGRWTAKHAIAATVDLGTDPKSRRMMMNGGSARPRAGTCSDHPLPA